MSTIDLDRLLPEPAHVIAASIDIDAPPSRVWHELMTVTLASLPVTSALTALRHLPARLIRRTGPLRGQDTFLEETPIPVVVANPPLQVISGGLTQPWRLLGGPPAPPLDLPQLHHWDKPGWVMVLMSFTLTPQRGTAITTLSTETRIGINDRLTARRFAPYWWLIRGGSAMIRREVLKQVKRRAEASPGTT